MLGDLIRKHKALSILVLLLVLIGISWGSFIAISRAGKEPIAVHLVPSDAIVTANSEKVSEGTAYLEPGTYTIEAKRGGFKDYKGTITIESPNKATIDIAMEPISASAREWQQKHQDLYLAYEGRAGQRATTEGESFTNANPITTKLPYKNLLYSIGYRVDPDDPANIIIEIDAVSGYRRPAIDKIRELGYDPTDFKINFRNYESPFSDE